jgi:hypothetical protein
MVGVAASQLAATFFLTDRAVSRQPPLIQIKAAIGRPDEAFTMGQVGAVAISRLSARGAPHATNVSEW